MERLLKKERIEVLNKEKLIDHFFNRGSKASLKPSPSKL